MRLYNVLGSKRPNQVRAISTSAIAFAAGIAAVSPGPANAVLVGVAVDNSNGLPVNWNDIVADISGNGFLQNLTDESGAQTSVDVRYRGYVGPNNIITTTGSSAVVSTTVPIHSTDLSSLNSQRQPAAFDDSLVFSGLDKGNNYRVWAIGISNGSYQNNWTITGQTSTSFSQSGNGGELTFNNQVGSSSQTLDSYAVTVRPDANGEISFDLTGLGARGKVAGIAIESLAPPPVIPPTTPFSQAIANDVQAINTALQNGTFIIPSGEAVTVPVGADVFLDSIRNSTGLLINEGTINNDFWVFTNSFGRTENRNTYNNSGTTQVAGSGEFTNAEGASFVNDNDLWLRGQGEFVNEGEFINNHLVRVNTDTGQQSRFTNDGTFTNQGSQVRIEEGSILSGTGTYNQTQGDTIVNGEFRQNSINLLGGTLSGTGEITVFSEDGLTIGADAVFAPGQSPGTFVINGNVSVEAGAILRIEVGADAASSDFVDINGALSFEDGAIIEFVFATGVTGIDVIDVDDYFSQPLDFSSSSVLFGIYSDELGPQATVSIRNQGALLGGPISVLPTSEVGSSNFLDQFSDVPEPGTFALFAGALIGFGAIRRKTSKAS